MHADNAVRTFWDYFKATVEREIWDRAAWEELRGTEFRERLHRALYLYGITNDDALVEPIGASYALAQQRMSVGERTALYFAIRRAFLKREIEVNALNPFCLLDEAPGIASIATVDIAVGGPPDPGDPLTWPRLIASSIERREPVSRAGVFAGLVRLGDARVFSLLDQVKWDLDGRELTTVLRCPVGRACIAELEFWLGWAEAIQRRDLKDGVTFGHCVSALLWVARDAVTDGFVDAAANFGRLSAPAGVPGTRVAAQHSLAEVAMRYSARLHALESREAPPRIVPDVLDAFGLAPRSPRAERAFPGDDADGGIVSTC